MQKLLNRSLKGIIVRRYTLIPVALVLIVASVILLSNMGLFSTVYSDSVENSYLPGSIVSPVDGTKLTGLDVTVDVKTTNSITVGTNWYYVKSKTITVFSDDNQWSEVVSDGAVVTLPYYDITYHVRLVMNIGIFEKDYSATNTYYSTFTSGPNPDQPTLPTGTISVSRTPTTRTVGQPLEVVVTWSGSDVNGDVTKVYLELKCKNTGRRWYFGNVYSGGAVATKSGTTDVIIDEISTGTFMYSTWIVVTDSGGRTTRVDATAFTITWSAAVVPTTTVTPVTTVIDGTVVEQVDQDVSPSGASGFGLLTILIGLIPVVLIVRRNKLERDE